jgi:segregation and condensation protein B
MIEKQQLRKIIEGALLAYGQPLSLDKLHSLFVTATTETETEEGDELPTAAQVDKAQISAVLEDIQNDCEHLGYELKLVGSGWRFQVREETAPWVNKLWDEKPQRYSRALMETIAIIAYRQPITRGDIEEIRGVAVSTNIIKTLSEREWIKVIGHRDVPGRPSLFATTKQFLDYFNLNSLEQLPSLKELTDIESLNPELNLQAVFTNKEGEVVLDKGVTEVETEVGEPLLAVEDDVDGDTEADNASVDTDTDTDTDTKNDEQVVH